MATLNIAALSRRTGVAADTLRKWEHRYSILQPSRTPGGQRRYVELAVPTLAARRAGRLQDRVPVLPLAEGVGGDTGSSRERRDVEGRHPWTTLRLRRPNVQRRDSVAAADKKGENGTLRSRCRRQTRCGARPRGSRYSWARRSRSRPRIR